MFHNVHYFVLAWYIKSQKIEGSSCKMTKYEEVQGVLIFLLLLYLKSHRKKNRLITKGYERLLAGAGVCWCSFVWEFRLLSLVVIMMVKLTVSRFNSVLFCFDALLSLRTHARCCTAVTRHSVIGAVEGGARATSVKQINAWRRITKRLRRLIATTAASSFLSHKYQVGSAEIRPRLPVLLMPVGQSAQARSAIPPFLCFTRLPSMGWLRKFSAAGARVHNLLYFPMLGSSSALEPAVVIAYAGIGRFGAAQQEKIYIWHSFGKFLSFLEFTYSKYYIIKQRCASGFGNSAPVSLHL